MIINLLNQDCQITKAVWQYISEVLFSHKFNRKGIAVNIPVYCKDIEVGYCSENMAKAILSDIVSSKK